MGERSIYLKLQSAADRRSWCWDSLVADYALVSTWQRCACRAYWAASLAWMFAALLFINFRSARASDRRRDSRRLRIVKRTVAPDAGGAGPLTLEGNIVGYVDRMIMPSHLLGRRSTRRPLIHPVWRS